MITGSDVLEVIDRLEAAAIDFWLDGGWGIDALLGSQTREHDDLDLVVRRQQCDLAVRTLAALGFAHDAEEKPGLPSRVVLRDGRGRRVDLHPVVFDEHGNGWQPLSDLAWGAYPAGDLNASGEVDGKEVPCISAELQLRHHLGYDWDEHDAHDMKLLASRFRLALPPGSVGVTTS